MSAQLLCDASGCGAIIEPNSYHLTVNVENDPVRPMPDDDGEILMIATMREIGQVDHHFCAPSCLAAWAMDRSIEDAA